jgi:serine/threonine protein kinase
MPVENLSARTLSIGQYDLLDKIAEGGMGTVYRGRNQITGEKVAIKVVPAHLLANPVVLKRFEQEYQVAKAIDHPNIVKALDFGRDGDARYLVMEFVEGESLGQRLEREGKMSEDEAIRIIIEAAVGLQQAHWQGLIHRDVKPDNILLTIDGQVKLTDLGLVKEIEADLNLTRTGRGLGTPHFMAPEQFRNAKKADVRCDIYSLGATLYMMVTGETPFKSNGPLDAWMKKINNEIDAPRDRVGELSERIDWAIRRAISADPIHRPESCREFVEDLTGQSTKQISATSAGLEKQIDYWYLTYTDEEGTEHTVKGTVKGIRRSLKEGLLGDAENVFIAQRKSGPYQAIRAFAEFRDLIVQPGKMLPKDPGSGTKTARPSGLTPTPSTASVAAASRNTPVSGVSAMPVAAATPAPVHLAINLHASDAPRSNIWKWLVFALLFAGAGVFVTLVLTLLRQFRLF